ncbi:hypothetical protein [Chitinibacter tainanensis]|uniref:hypothetical protein n=1 Tax=Chitinibacter tainanensis TaxID=230667 RepID=UPI0023536CA1|nr:hypothetical protein [Chitinibacter tainanensis]
MIFLLVLVGCGDSNRDEYRDAGVQTLPPAPMTGVSANQAQQFGTYRCTDDCSGHQAGYDWAEQQGIDDENDCTGNSESFIDGCKQFIEEAGASLE